VALDERSLERILEFNDDDLAANRAGRLSPGQIGRLRSFGIWRLVVGPPVLVAAVVVALLVDNAFFAVLALVFAAAGLFCTWSAFAFLADAFDGTVAHVTGPLRRRAESTKSGMLYFASVGPVTKNISASAYDYLPEGLSCHLYYAPGCRSLLSLELASAEEPKPAHPFGPDSAHVWDRLRWSWVLMTVGVLGVLIGAYVVANAHAAHPFTVGGTIAHYEERHGKSSTSRYVYIAGDTDSYSVEWEGAYAPPVPAWTTMIGRDVVLHVNAGTRDVIGLSDGAQLYAADWYLHPEHEANFQVVNGAITGGVALISFLLGLAGVVFGRRFAAAVAASAAVNTGPSVEAPESSAPLPLYVPPAVRPFQALWPQLFLLGAILATVLIFLALALRK
jgi:hypothetical protein